MILLLHHRRRRRFVQILFGRILIRSGCRCSHLIVLVGYWGMVVSMCMWRRRMTRLLGCSMLCRGMARMLCRRMAGWWCLWYYYSGRIRGIILITHGMSGVSVVVVGIAVVGWLMLLLVGCVGVWWRWMGRGVLLVGVWMLSAAATMLLLLLLGRRGVVRMIAVMRGKRLEVAAVIVGVDGIVVDVVGIGRRGRLHDGGCVLCFYSTFCESEGVQWKN
mmetsp:Transcript_6303/g.14222  ORF Transcript_6303/g.14222 Transcript_6303/m.14222 type:complete len:218 (-) Transcript_6303:3-656(-)